MIDIHCHILHDADDGPSDIDTSIKMAELSISEGIKSIIATPHYIIGENNEKEVIKKVDNLNLLFQNKGMDMVVYPGNELFIDFDILEKLESGECLSLAGSKYVLVEFPMLEVPEFSDDFFYELQLKGYVPIIAHPERNRGIISDPTILYHFIKNGCLAQLNTPSLLGVFGDEIKNTAELLLKNNLVHFLATDAHSAGRRRPIYNGIAHKIEEICGKDTADSIMQTNAKAILKNSDLNMPDPTLPKQKKKFFGLW